MGFLSLQSITPPGVILPFAGSLAPNGWLLCQGQAVSRPISAGGSTDTYKALYAAIGTTYGAGDGSTTFNLPNTQGRFLRGNGNNNLGLGTTAGTYQDDAFQGHTHTYTVRQQLSGGGGGSDWAFDTSTQTSLPNAAVGYGSIRYTNETRPSNVGVNYIIKI
jgi:microcystin-dependent protein